MAFQKGQSGNPAGRKPGTQNRLTLTVKQGFEAAFEKMQDGEHALDKWAAKNPTDFYKLASKLIPVQMAHQGGIALQVISGVPSDEDQEHEDAPDDGSDLA